MRDLDRDDGPRDERLYEAYLDAVLAGAADDPADFLAAAGVESAGLKARLEEVHRLAGRAAEASAEAWGPGTVVGRYRIERELSSGGMGTIYLAHDRDLDREVALKVVRTDLLRSPAALERFGREARALARLRHPHIVTVHDFGELDGRSFMAMEFVAGRSMAEALAEAEREGRRMPAPDAVRQAAQAARALECAHASGILHRDVKPSNVRLTESGDAVLVDFGLTRDIEDEGRTLTGEFVGSPTYASPEQVSGDAKLDARTDVYSLGVTLYHALTGRSPFRAETVERVFQRVLFEEPAPLRELDAAFGRDLDVVVRKAMEKRRDDRYATAAELADDLEALLALRPVRARPPGWHERAARWARRHRPAAAALVAGLVTAVAASVLALVQLRLEAREREAQARELVGEASSLVETLRDERDGVRDVEREVLELRGWAEARYMTPEELAFLGEREVEVHELALAHESRFHEVLDLLRAAERLDPEVAGTDDVRAELYLTKLAEAHATDDVAAARVFDRLLSGSDPDGVLRERAYPYSTVTFTSEPPDAEVHVFRLEERPAPGGVGVRVAPVPVTDAPTAVEPGTEVLRVVGAAGELEVGDLVLDVDAEPGGSVRIVREGELLEATLAAGARLRATAMPYLTSPATANGRTPLDLRLETGEYVAVMRADGLEELRVGVPVRSGADPHVRVELLPAALTLPGHVRVVSPSADRDFWMMEREVTCAEYLAFLNDPAVQALVDASDSPVLYPRDANGSHWPRGSDGRFVLQDGWHPRWPVVGVSFEDAGEYARWRTYRARAEGHDVEFFLPTYGHLAVAAAGLQYSWGDRFSPHFSNTCFSRPNANLEPVMSYMLDQTPLGVFDLCGGAFEWQDDWFDEARGLRRAGGGSWARGEAEMSRVAGGIGLGPRQTTGETGIRLCYRRTP